MSLLEGLVTQVLKSSLGSAQPNNANQGAGGLGDLLGAALGGTQKGQAGGLGDILGQLANQAGGQSSANAGLGGLLGTVLGGASKSNAGDLGNVLGALLGNQKQAGGFNKSALLIALLPVVLAFIQKNGGLSGVLAKFNQSGMSQKAQSWVNVDTNNDGIDASDVSRLFGSDEIADICQKTGASQEQVCQGIAELLPQVVNDLTPHGDVKADEAKANDEISQLLAQIGKAV